MAEPTVAAGRPSIADAVHATSDFHQQGKASSSASAKNVLGSILHFPLGILFETDQQDVSCPCHRLSVSQTILRCVAPDCWSYAALTFFHMTLTICTDAAEMSSQSIVLYVLASCSIKDVAICNLG